MIRRAGLEDVSDVYHLIGILEEQETFDRDAFSEVYAGQLASERHICLLYEEDGIVKGLLNMRIEAQLHHRRRTAQITELIVAPPYRDRGIGTELFRTAEKTAEAHDCERIELETSLWRKKAHAFYERMGMVPDHYFFTKNLK
jgi:PhnO protein